MSAGGNGRTGYLSLGRCLRPGFTLILTTLIWNERRTGSPFEKEYDQLIIKHGKDYVQVDHRNIDAEHISAFFTPAALSA
jgi:hypothetical protein